MVEAMLSKLLQAATLTTLAVLIKRLLIRKNYPCPTVDLKPAGFAVRIANLPESRK